MRRLWVVLGLCVFVSCSTVELYFMCAPPPFVRLLMPPADAQPTAMDTDDVTAVEAAEAPTLTEVAFASLRLLRALPNLRHVWDCTPLLALLSHEVRGITFFAAALTIRATLPLPASRIRFPPCVGVWCKRNTLTLALARVVVRGSSTGLAFLNAPPTQGYGLAWGTLIGTVDGSRGSSGYWPTRLAHHPLDAHPSTHSLTRSLTVRRWRRCDGRRWRAPWCCSLSTPRGGSSWQAAC